VTFHPTRMHKTIYDYLIFQRISLLFSTFSGRYALLQEEILCLLIAHFDLSKLYPMTYNDTTNFTSAAVYLSTRYLIHTKLPNPKKKFEVDLELNLKPTHEQV